MCGLREHRVCRSCWLSTAQLVAPGCVAACARAPAPDWCSAVGAAHLARLACPAALCSGSLRPALPPCLHSYAIGGLAGGESKDDFWKMVALGADCECARARLCGRRAGGCV